MKRNMNQWLNEMIALKTKKALPVLSFPGIQLMGISVRELVASSDKQAACMKTIADRYDAAASVSNMDLSVEAEAFGSTINYSDVEVPTVIGRLVDTEEDAEKLVVPEVGAGRTGECVKAISKALELITDRPVLAGVIGPFSLSGRLMDMTEIMIKCMVEPETAHKTLDKAAAFITKYILAFKEAGANGIVMAEPAAGLLSPDLNKEFSSQYVKQIIDTVQDENFIVIYHNCGNIIPLLKDLLWAGAKAYHFGNAVSIRDVVPMIPEGIPVMGNVDPASLFRNGTPENIYEETHSLLEDLSKYPNYIISSGCDIPPISPLKNIDSFFKAIDDFYSNRTY